MTPTTALPIRHSTYFKLPAGSTPLTRSAYASACQAYLSASEGMISFAVGQRVEDIVRKVSDLDFDIAMHQVFQNTDAFNRYNGSDPRHDQFVAEVNRWAPGTTRRVLDSFLSHLFLVSSLNPAHPPLRHSLYFKLTDPSTQSILKFGQICLSLLSGHDGESLFALGECGNPLHRDVNVQNFDVSVDTEWVDRTSYDSYEASDRHKAFFTMTEGMISATHIFDSQSSQQ